MSKQQDRFDDILDAALASYTEECEPIGLQTRILARLEETRKPLRSLWYAAAALVCACFCYMVLIQKPEPGSPERQPQPAAAPSTATSTMQPAAVASTVTHTRRRRRTEEKRPQFPAPTPMTEEERALLKLARRHRADIPTELAGLGAPIDRIEIAPVDVKPLE